MGIFTSSTDITTQKMKGGVVTKFRLIVFLPSILVLWDDKGTLAGSVPQMHDSSQFPKLLNLGKPGGKKSLIEIEGETGRKESVQKQTEEPRDGCRNCGFRQVCCNFGNGTKRCEYPRNCPTYGKENGIKSRQQIESRDYFRKDKSQCKDVTFGECPALKEKTHDIIHNMTVIRCQTACYHIVACDFYRFNRQNKECTLLSSSYKSLCKIRAAPVEKQASTCLRSIQPCDPQTEEDCEYTGNDVKKYPPGEISDAETCQDSCKNSAPTCKYWIYNII